MCQEIKKRLKKMNVVSNLRVLCNKVSWPNSQNGQTSTFFFYGWAYVQKEIKFNGTLLLLCKIWWTWEIHAITVYHNCLTDLGGSIALLLCHCLSEINFLWKMKAFLTLGYKKFVAMKIMSVKILYGTLNGRDGATWKFENIYVIPFNVIFFIYLLYEK